MLLLLFTFGHTAMHVTDQWSSGQDNTCILYSRDASMMSMRRKIAGLKPEQIKQLGREDLDLPVSMQDFNDALSKCNKSVSKTDLDKYVKWMTEFGSSWLWLYCIHCNKHVFDILFLQFFITDLLMLPLYVTCGRLITVFGVEYLSWKSLHGSTLVAFLLNKMLIYK